MFTIDASVYVNALNSAEEGAPESEEFVERVFQRPWPVFSPTLLLVEMATAISRVLADPNQGLAVAQAVQGLPGQRWIPLEDSLAGEAAWLGAHHRLRGADAVYAAVARRYGTTLVTRDRQQLERLQSTLLVITPSEALARLAETETDEEEASR